MFQVYSTVVSGELQGSTTALQLPDIPSRLVVFKALADNAGTVWLGGAGVTVPDGTTDATSGIGLAAGEQVTLYIDNLSRLYRICTNTGDDVSYLVQR